MVVGDLGEFSQQVLVYKVALLITRNCRHSKLEIGLGILGASVDGSCIRMEIQIIGRREPQTIGRGETQLSGRGKTQLSGRGETKFSGRGETQLSGRGETQISGLPAIADSSCC